MAESTLVKKLLIKPGMTMLVLNAPAGYFDTLGQLPGSVKLIDKLEGTVDFAQIFVKAKQEVDATVPGILKVLKNDGLFWISYPKGTSKVSTDLNRDVLWEIMKKYGLAGVAMVSVDNVWSAMRLRPVDKVGR